MKTPDIDLDEVRPGKPLPTWAAVIVARAMREGFAGPYDDPDDDGPSATYPYRHASPCLKTL